MSTYVVCRLLQSVLVLFLVSLTMFALLRSVPEDLLLAQLDQAAALRQEDLARARQELGLERPFWRQYAVWLGAALHGDLGNSLTSQQPVSQELGKRVTLTLHLVCMALGVALLLALPASAISAVWPGTVADYLGRMLALAGLSCPAFWVATMTSTVMTLWRHGMPPIGFEPLWSDPVKCIAQLLLPAVIIGARLSAGLMCVIRAALLKVRRDDCRRIARAKGQRVGALILQHGLKNVGMPVLTRMGQQFSVLLGGTVLVEVIFLLPGVGTLTLDAAMLRDYTMLQGAVLFFAGAMVGMKLCVDLSSACVDPRLRDP